MREIYGTISDSGDGKIIELKFKSLVQLLDETDPSPLPEKELTLRAEKEILRYVDQVPVRKAVVLRVLLPADEFNDERGRHLPDTIRRHFSYRTSRHIQTMKITWREGQISTFIATINVVFLVFIAYWLFPHYLDSLPGLLIMGFFTILNWVTIWDTYEFFVYDWRHFNKKKRILKKISGMNISAGGYRRPQ
jgi:hypothetical protein